ncbi:unnamed protein product [Linum tenue]|uniref:Triosephosphate isomerase, cytosolic n=1 Tax=Linum tenue TaxID=586396 RepID=A0AAV0JMX9_9ROSI|nr:unnamed protein product [Linum tenue]
MARKFFVGGNWKCNGTTEEVKKIVSTLNGGDVPSPDVVEVVVSPPFVFLPLVKTTLRPDFHVAAQNCWVKNGGAYTGEVSAEMLVNLDIPWVILGHSERRSLLKESNDFVGGKVATPAQAQEVHSELRDWLQANTSPEIASTTRIIYGGSVSGGNCKELAAKPDVDGFLVGGASLKPEFIDIIKSAEVKKSS